MDSLLRAVQVLQPQINSAGQSSGYNICIAMTTETGGGTSTACAVAWSQGFVQREIAVLHQGQMQARIKHMLQLCCSTRCDKLQFMAHVTCVNDRITLLCHKVVDACMAHEVGTFASSYFLLVWVEHHMALPVKVQNRPSALHSSCRFSVCSSHSFSVKGRRKSLRFKAFQPCCEAWFMGSLRQTEDVMAAALRVE